MNERTPPEPQPAIDKRGAFSWSGLGPYVSVAEPPADIAQDSDEPKKSFFRGVAVGLAVMIPVWVWVILWVLH